MDDSSVGGNLLNRMTRLAIYVATAVMLVLVSGCHIKTVQGNQVIYAAGIWTYAVIIGLGVASLLAAWMLISHDSTEPSGWMYLALGVVIAPIGVWVVAGMTWVVDNQGVTTPIGRFLYYEIESVHVVVEKNTWTNDSQELLEFQMRDGTTHRTGTPGENVADGVIQALRDKGKFSDRVTEDASVAVVEKYLKTVGLIVVAVLGGIFGCTVIAFICRQRRRSASNIGEQILP